MITVNKTIAKLGGTLIGTHPAGSTEWHIQRAHAIGGSDIAPILNKSPWTSAVYLWAQKSGKLIPPEGTMAMKLGNYFEPAIVRLFGDMHPHLTIHSGDNTYASQLNNAFHANPDAVIEDEDGRLSILEIKFSRNAMTVLPEHYRLQVLWYQIVTGLHSPAVLCAVAGGEYREFTVEYDQTEAEQLMRSAEVFLELVRSGTEPVFDGSDSTYTAVRILHPDIEDTETDIDAKEYRLLLDALEQEKFWKQQATLRKSVIQNSMQGARYGYVDGENVVMLQSRSGGTPYLKITGGY
jgi:predicted phage-related endonuclease